MYSNTSDALPLPLAYVAFLYVPAKSRFSFGSLPCATKTGSLKLALKLRVLPAPYVPLATRAVTLCRNGLMPSILMVVRPSESDPGLPGFGRMQPMLSPWLTVSGILERYGLVGSPHQSELLESI